MLAGAGAPLQRLSATPKSRFLPIRDRLQKADLRWTTLSVYQGAPSRVYQAPGVSRQPPSESTSHILESFLYVCPVFPIGSKVPNNRRSLSIPLHAQQTSQEAAVWKLETAYWDYVQVGDMNTFLTLWHANFVGWPALADKPRRKDSIAATYTALCATGEHLASYTIKGGRQLTHRQFGRHPLLGQRYMD